MSGGISSAMFVKIKTIFRGGGGGGWCQSDYEDHSSFLAYDIKVSLVTCIGPD